jgi:tetratricopeptide (TPR) repeat protein
MISLLLSLAIVPPQLGTLEGYLLRETDGGPPRRPMTVELIDKDRAKYREKTAADGSFVFNKVREGRYTIRARFSDFIIAEDAVTVRSSGRNFTAVMLPKRWAGGQTFRTVTADHLAAQSNRQLQEKVRNAIKLAAKGDFAGAARLYEQAAATGAQADLWDRLGLLYLQMGRKDDAFHAFEKAIEQDPKYLLSYRHVGTVYLEERRYKELLAVAKRALAIDPKWLTGYVFLGEAQAKTGDLEAAQQAAETASKLARAKAPEPYLLLAKIHWARRDCAGARQHMGRYLELNTSARELPETQKSLEMLQACGPVQSK